MHILGPVAGALLGVAIVVGPVPAWSQSQQGGQETPTAQPAPGGAGNSAGGSMEPAEAEGKNKSEAESAAPGQSPGGCPLINRKLDLIV